MLGLRTVLQRRNVMQVVHIVSKHPDGTDVRHYRHLLHRHYYQAKSSQSQTTGLMGTTDKDQVVEEPDESKVSGPF